MNMETLKPAAQQKPTEVERAYRKGRADMLAECLVVIELSMVPFAPGYFHLKNLVETLGKVTP